MSSTIEAAARQLVKKAKNGMYSDKDILQLIKAVQECDEDTDGKKALYRVAAINQYQSDSDLLIDGDATVSASKEGAYIQAWVWVQGND
jgi:hypothetical protein